MMGKLRGALAALWVVAAGACASAGQQSGASARDEDVITTAELRQATVANLGDYIQAHRPRWLERNYAPVFRAARVQGLVVFMDEQPYGGPETLRSIRITSVREVRYFSPSEAEGRFGQGYINGVIQVLTSAGG